MERIHIQWRKESVGIRSLFGCLVKSQSPQNLCTLCHKSREMCCCCKMDPLTHSPFNSQFIGTYLLSLSVFMEFFFFFASTPLPRPCGICIVMKPPFSVKFLFPAPSTHFFSFYILNTDP